MVGTLAIMEPPTYNPLTTPLPQKKKKILFQSAISEALNIHSLSLVKQVVQFQCSCAWLREEVINTRTNGWDLRCSALLLICKAEAKLINFCITLLRADYN